MENKQNNDAYAREISSLIASGVKPEDAKKIADSHYENYGKVVKKVADERKLCKEKAEAVKKEYEKATQLSARIKAGEKPEPAFEDMYGREM